MAYLLLSTGQYGPLTEYKLICSDYQFSYTREGDNAVYISVASKDYKTEYTDLSQVSAHINKQCRPERDKPERNKPERKTPNRQRGHKW